VVEISSAKMSLVGEHGERATRLTVSGTKLSRQQAAEDGKTDSSMNCVALRCVRTITVSKLVRILVPRTVQYACTRHTSHISYFANRERDDLPVPVLLVSRYDGYENDGAKSIAGSTHPPSANLPNSQGKRPILAWLLLAAKKQFGLPSTAPYSSPIITGLIIAIGSEAPFGAEDDAREGRPLGEIARTRLRQRLSAKCLSWTILRILFCAMLVLRLATLHVHSLVRFLSSKFLVIFFLCPPISNRSTYTERYMHSTLLPNIFSSSSFFFCITSSWFEALST
jgi:hypothetical protein